MDAGLIKSGITINQAFELDEDACKTYRANFGEHVKECDITQELVLEQDCCHGMVFTYPCTKYSTAANLNGTRTGDELFLHALRHLAIARPEFYVVENVPGMKAFPVVIEAMTKMPDYYVQVFCPVQSELWLPQRRDRLIIIGTKRHFSIRPPENMKPVKLSDILETDPIVTITQSVYARLNGKYRDKPIISDPNNDDIAPTCVAHYAKDKSTRLVVDKRFPHGVRPYSVREYARLQGVDDNFTFPVSDNLAYRQIGNGVSVPVAQWVGSEMVRYMKQLTII